jgi:tripartite-type tricarboxylate transporter receptor subunit TctC
MTRRVEFCRASGFAVLALALTFFISSSNAWAQSYPNKPVRLIVPYTPGSGTDIVARGLADQLSSIMGQSFVVENRPGADGNVGAAAVARSAPDGYTLIAGTPGLLVTGRYFYKDLQYDPDKDLLPVAMVAYSPFVLIVSSSLPAKTLKEFLALAKEKPGMKFGSAGIGSSPHLGGEMLRVAAGIDIVHVPYAGGSQLMPDIGAGRIQINVGSIASTLTMIKSGQVRPLAIASASRSALFPELATLDESGFPGFDVNSWISVMAPAGTPKDVVDKLYGAIAQAMKSPRLLELIANSGTEPHLMDPVEMTTYLAAQRARWEKVIPSLLPAKN